jgi:Kef-type K+ transport system membrane component KefB
MSYGVLGTSGGTHAVLGAVLVQMLVILAAARLGAVVARRLWQPEVVGEFVAGLLLGPSLLGRCWPEGFAALFQPTLEGGDAQTSAVSQLIGVLAQFGVILLLFEVGLELNQKYLHSGWRVTIAMAGAGLVVPLLAGMPLGLWLVQQEMGMTAGLQTPAVWFVTIALAVTALPVLARILIDLQVLQTRLAALLLGAAVISDLLLWFLLAGATAAARSQWQWERLVQNIMATALFLVTVFGPMRWGAKRYFQAQLRRNNSLSSAAWSVLLLLVLLCALAALYAGLHALFGAFVAGAALAGIPGLHQEVTLRLQRLVHCLFVPLFFACAGLHTDVSVMLQQWSLAVCATVMMVAFLVKWFPCTLTAWIAGLPRRDAVLVGIMMNTRGLMGLVVASIGYDVGALSPALYALLVLMAEIMTLLTTPLVLLCGRDSEWEAPLVAAGRLAPTSGTGLIPPTGQFVKKS